MSLDFGTVAVCWFWVMSLSGREKKRRHANALPYTSVSSASRPGSHSTPYQCPSSANSRQHADPRSSEDNASSEASPSVKFIFFSGIFIGIIFLEKRFSFLQNLKPLP